MQISLAKAWRIEKSVNGGRSFTSSPVFVVVTIKAPFFCSKARHPNAGPSHSLECPPGLAAGASIQGGRFHPTKEVSAFAFGRSRSLLDLFQTTLSVPMHLAAAFARDPHVFFHPPFRSRQIRHVIFDGVCSYVRASRLLLRTAQRSPNRSPPCCAVRTFARFSRYPPKPAQRASFCDRHDGQQFGFSNNIKMLARRATQIA